MKKLLILALISLSAHAGSKETTYERYDGDESTITITDMGHGDLQVKGLALWVNIGNNVAHTGELDSAVKVKDGIAHYAYSGCNLTLKFIGKELLVSDDTGRGTCGGMNVTFNGHYKISNK